MSFLVYRFKSHVCPLHAFSFPLLYWITPVSVTIFLRNRSAKAKVEREAENLSGKTTDEQNEVLFGQENWEDVSTKL